MIRTYELQAIYDSRKSFYGKATVEVRRSKDFTMKTLYSYGTEVARVKVYENVVNVEVFDTYSATTLRHIKEFLNQENFKAETKKQIENDYMEV